MVGEEHGRGAADGHIEACWLEWVDLGVGLQRSEEHTSELQSQSNLVCRLLLEKKKTSQRLLHRSSRELALGRRAAGSTGIRTANAGPHPAPLDHAAQYATSVGPDRASCAASAG